MDTPKHDDQPHPPQPPTTQDAQADPTPHSVRYVYRSLTLTTAQALQPAGTSHYCQDTQGDETHPSSWTEAATEAEARQLVLCMNELEAQARGARLARQAFDAILGGAR